MAKAKSTAPPLGRIVDAEDPAAALLRRAFAAWFRGGAADIPSNDSEVVAHAGHWYVVLRGGRGPNDRALAVYRLKNDGVLRRLRRWPAKF